LVDWLIGFGAWGLEFGVWSLGLLGSGLDGGRSTGFFANCKLPTANFSLKGFFLEG
jgi:hypothetical protein